MIPEETSEQVEGFFNHLEPREELIVSQWTRAEFGSVLSRLVRMKQLSQPIATECGIRFETLLIESFEIVTPQVADFNHCWELLIRFDNSLRLGDALHLAIAGNLGVEAVYTLDGSMLQIGKRLGFPVYRGIGGE
jgi:predicted nucleic acid-binding protein